VQGLLLQRTPKLEGNPLPQIQVDNPEAVKDWSQGVICGRA
jgi:hypothetical protein